MIALATTLKAAKVQADSGCLYRNPDLYVLLPLFRAYNYSRHVTITDYYDLNSYFPAIGWQLVNPDSSTINFTYTVSSGDLLTPFLAQLGPLLADIRWNLNWQVGALVLPSLVRENPHGTMQAPTTTTFQGWFAPGNAVSSLQALTTQTFTEQLNLNFTSFYRTLGAPENAVLVPTYMLQAQFNALQAAGVLVISPTSPLGISPFVYAAPYGQTSVTWQGFVATNPDYFYINWPTLVPPVYRYPPTYGNNALIPPAAKFTPLNVLIQFLSDGVNAMTQAPAGVQPVFYDWNNQIGWPTQFAALTGISDLASAFKTARLLYFTNNDYLPTDPVVDLENYLSRATAGKTAIGDQGAPDTEADNPQVWDILFRALAFCDTKYLKAQPLGT